MGMDGSQNCAFYSGISAGIISGQQYLSAVAPCLSLSIRLQEFLGAFWKPFSSIQTPGNKRKSLGQIAGDRWRDTVT
ncbi:homeobox protein Hox-B4a [Scomber scombrus]|uniref:Homeobox protein Hox-B4a n=1 Tax=Scomber scombrus TaxID=13677 RepID=A0AAV1PNG3_SCOSC